MNKTNLLNRHRFISINRQIAEGNLIPNIKRCWDEIGCFQCGDNPGRKDLVTGEINYRSAFIHSLDA